jgi:hypothetical protein
VNGCDEAGLKSPSIPLFQRGNVTKTSEKPLFEKEGQGEIYSATSRTKD